jgi:hypothetical protein
VNARKTVRQPDGLRSEEPVRDDVWEAACVVPLRKLARAPSLDIYVGEFSSSINALQCADPELATNNRYGFFSVTPGMVELGAALRMPSPVRFGGVLAGDAGL